MVDSKIIWVAGMPRAGSMWTYNVTRRLLQADGNDVQPKFVPKSDKQVAELARQAMRDPDPARIYIFKTHARIKSEFQHEKYITVVRDIRDALVSWMRFMHSDFDAALTAARDMITTVDYYKSFPRENILHLAYGNITSDPGKVCTEIIRFLSIDIPEADVKSIVDMFSKNTVIKSIAKKEQDISNNFQANEAVSEDEIIRNYDGSLRAYDSETGFQSGHVTRYRDGDWRNILTRDEQGRMNEALGDWLKKNGCFK